MDFLYYILYHEIVNQSSITNATQNPVKELDAKNFPRRSPAGSPLVFAARRRFDFDIINADAQRRNGVLYEKNSCNHDVGFHVLVVSARFGRTKRDGDDSLRISRNLQRYRGRFGAVKYGGERQDK